VRITGISTHVVGTPWRNLTYVLVHTDEGITGVGETRMLGHTDALIGYLREAEQNHILGSDPFAVEDLTRRMKYGDYGRAGEIVMSGVAVVEMACWDIKGKALGVPVWQLLGGKVTDRVKAYANGWYTTERTPDAYHKAAQEVMAHGYRALKIDPFGTGHFELDHEQTMYAVSLIEAVRDAIGPDSELMLEMHGRFSPATAVRLAKELAPFKPAWLEEPVPPENLKALEKVAAKVDMPVATGERIHDRIEFRELFESQAVDIIQPDVGHIGGIWETRKLAATAETSYVLIAPHNVGGPVATAANLHLAACTPNFKIQEHFNDFADAWVQELVDAPPRVDPRDGCFALPDRPGLGLALDRRACAAHPRTGGRIQLFESGWERRGFGGARARSRKRA
jgi:galactonate dehydratase